MINAVIYFVAALILFIIFILVVVAAVALGITLAKSKEKKNAQNNPAPENNEPITPFEEEEK